MESLSSMFPNTVKLAREAFLHQPNWNKYFFDAAFPSPSSYPGPNMGLNSPAFRHDDHVYTIGATRPLGLHIPEMSAVDRREAVHHLMHEHPMLTTPPPSEYVWGADTFCPSVGTIDMNDYIDGVPRRSRPPREANLYFNPCPANTFYGIGWKKMQGFSGPQPEYAQRGCLPPLLFMDRM